MSKNNEKKIVGEICVVVGTRPGIIMLAPVIHQLAQRNIPHYVVHTGQHYSPFMDSELFEDLNLPEPAFHLKDIDKKPTHGTQTAAMIEGCEAAFLQRRPALVLVNGDANTNLAAALAARKLRICLGHIEAGERSYDWRMPEEHNRRMMDHISELLFATNAKAQTILHGEKVPGQVHISGNTIADASFNHAIIAQKHAKVLEKYDLEHGQYIVMTSHREENVDDRDKLRAIIEGAQKLAKISGYKILFLAHPRTQKRIGEFNLNDIVEKSTAIEVMDALRYLDFMQLLVNSRMVLTDSGGVQQEAYLHKRPCVTMRDNTEWIETLENGGNRLSGADNPEIIAKMGMEALSIGEIEWPQIFGDGKAAKRIVDASLDFLNPDKQ